MFLISVMRKTFFTALMKSFLSLWSLFSVAQETWSEIHLFGTSHEDYFKKRLPTLIGIPSDDTFNRFFSLLNIDWFEEAFRLWISDICHRVPGVVAIDGKAVCRNPDSAGHGMKDRLYMVSAWAVRKACVWDNAKWMESQMR